MVISGPADPVFMAFLIPKILQNILESIWEHLGNILASMSDNQKNENSRKANPLFWIYFLYICFVSIFWMYIFKINFRRWGTESDSFSINQIHKSLDVNFICVKKHEQDFTLNFVFRGMYPKVCCKECTLNLFQGRYPKLFYVQERESSNLH